jgi:16S rRNA processing protein RimM
VAGGVGEPAAPEHLIVGHITKPHGTKGEVFVLPLTDEPDAVFGRDATLLLGDARGELGDAAEAIVVEDARAFKRGVLVKFAGVDDRDAAGTLSGRYLLLGAEALRPLEEGELFYHQLLGATVETVDGRFVGRVREVFETEPAHLLEVKGDDGKLHLVPFVERIVKTVDAEKRRILIDPPAGLLDL